MLKSNVQKQKSSGEAKKTAAATNITKIIWDFS